MSITADWFSNSNDPAEGRDRLVVEADLVALLRGHTNANAAGIGPFEGALDRVQGAVRTLSTAPSRDQVVRALSEAHAEVVAFNRTLPYHRVNVSAVVVWGEPSGASIAQVGGGHVFRMRRGEVTCVSRPRSVYSEWLERRHDAPRRSQGTDLAVLYTSQLGVEPGSAEPALRDVPLDPDDRLILVSAGADTLESATPIIERALLPGPEGLSARISGRLLALGARDVLVAVLQFRR